MLREQGMLLTVEELKPLVDKAWRKGQGVLHGKLARYVAEAQRDKDVNLFKAEVDKLTVIDDEELEIAVNEWVNEDWAVRYIRLNRGHYGDILPIIAKAQLQHDKQTLLDLMGE